MSHDLLATTPKPCPVLVDHLDGFAGEDYGQLFGASSHTCEDRSFELQRGGGDLILQHCGIMSVFTRSLLV